MRSDRSLPPALPIYTRLTHDGKDYVAHGSLTDTEMLEAVKAKLEREARRDVLA